MKLGPKLICASAFLLFCGAIAYPQEEMAGPGRCYVTDKPYSAVIEVESVQTLENGAHITRNNNFRKVYRDSAGRTREESYTKTNQGGESTDALIFVDVHDPLTETTFELNPQEHSARQMADDRGAWPHENPCPANAVPALNGQKNIPTRDVSTTATPAQRLRPQLTFEQLGTQQMEGLDVVGIRRTQTYPAGAAHNDQPFQVVTEIWTSSDLGITVLSKTNDPRFGETTRQMTNVDRSEPDPALFRVPDDYTITKDSPDGAQQ